MKRRIGNKNVYLDTLRALKAYKSTNSLQPEDIDYNFLKGFEHFQLREEPEMVEFRSI
ncbi:MAG: phage integrase SAM-like domain-containing protein [Saprospiraceae bacterium]|nr:phage integrase SAM-like domain-containing protein [Candidatus Vicinibacter affinis]